MGYTRYTKKRFAWEELSAGELFEKLADYLLHSGFTHDFEAGDYTLAGNGTAAGDDNRAHRP